MGDLGFGKKDKNGKESMFDEEDLIVGCSKRSKKEEVKPPKVEVSTHEVKNFQHLVYLF